MVEMPLGWFIALVILASIGAFVLFIMLVIWAGLLFFKVADWIEYKLDHRNLPHDSRDN